jgi:hypothetical protein
VSHGDTTLPSSEASCSALCTQDVAGDADGLQFPGGAGDAESLDNVDEVGAGSLDGSDEVRDSVVGLQDGADGVLLRRLLGTQRD